MRSIYLKYCFFTVLVMMSLQVIATPCPPTCQKHKKSRLHTAPKKSNGMTPEQKKRQIQRMLDEKLIRNRHVDTSVAH